MTFMQLFFSSKHMLDLVSEHEPEVIETVVQGRHTDNWRIFVEPRTNAVDLRIWQHLNDNETHAAGCEYRCHLSKGRRNNHQCSKLRYCGAQFLLGEGWH